MATRYVNTASTAGGDGTTNLTSGSTRAYPSLNVWEAARQATLSEVEEVICEGTAADATAVTIDGWTTTASFYIDIKALSSAGAGRHAGVWSTSKYRLAVAADFIYVLLVVEPYTRLTGLQIENTSANGAGVLSHEPGVTSANDGSIYEALICRGANWAGAGMGITQGDANVTYRNCVSYDNIVNGFQVMFSGSGPATANYLNCVAAGNAGSGFFNGSGSNVVAYRNCYAGGNTGADFSTNAAGATVQTCATEDATAGATVAYSNVERRLLHQHHSRQ